MAELVAGVVLFTLLVTALAAVVLVGRRVLLSDGDISVTVNGSALTVPAARSLLDGLAQGGIVLPAACAGRSMCGQCKLTIVDCDDAPLPVETAHLTPGEARAGVRLACAHRTREGLRLQLPDELLHVSRIDCTVIGARNVSAYLREIRLQLPAGQQMPFRAGQYVMVEAPPYRMHYRDIELDADTREQWDAAGLLSLESESDAPERRAYSLANAPGDGTVLELVVRIALPPPGKRDALPPGVVSSWLYGLRPGDTVPVAGPYGDFAMLDTPREKVFIAGGAGIAPMRAILSEALSDGSDGPPMSLWYGARTLRDLCYASEFGELDRRHERFGWHVALSEPEPDTEWRGPTGFVHTLLRDEFLVPHPAPEEAEYYLCGPPLMRAAVVHLLDEFGVHPSSIFHDSFTGGT